MTTLMLRRADEWHSFSNPWRNGKPENRGNHACAALFCCSTKASLSLGLCNSSITGYLQLRLKHPRTGSAGINVPLFFTVCLLYRCLSASAVSPFGEQFATVVSYHSPRPKAAETLQHMCVVIFLAMYLYFVVGVRDHVDGIRRSFLPTLSVQTFGQRGRCCKNARGGYCLNLWLSKPQTTIQQDKASVALHDSC